MPRPQIWFGKAGGVEDDCACAGPYLYPAGEDHALEQDCACAQSVLVEERSGQAKTWRLPEGLQWIALPQGYRLAWGPPGSSLTLLNPPAWERLQSFGTPRPLQAPFDERLVAAGLLTSEQEAILPTDTLSPTMLTLWLHVTNACNLNCPYCYVHKDKAALDEEQGLALLRQAMRLVEQGPFHGLKVKYAGGEPMLAFQRLQRWQTWLEEETARRGLRMEAVVLTNGTRMTHEQARWLQAHQVKVMASVDGVGEVHDRLRSDRRGRGSFELVQHTVDEVLLPLGIRPTVSMTLTSLNVHQAPAMAQWAIIERELPLSFNFYRRGLDGPEALRPDLEALIYALEQAYRLLEGHLPTWPFTSGLLDRVRLFPHERTCGVGQHYLAVTHRGQVASCHMLLQHPVATEISTEAVQRAMQQVPNLRFDQKECLDCPFVTLCTGGCPLETYSLTGRWASRNPYCAVYRALLPRLLRLEGLRLMKKHGLWP